MTTSSRVAQTRLKSSFIYLANAVNDLRGNWNVLALIGAPLTLAAALCLLPDALNLQHRVVQTFEAAGGQSVSYLPAQVHPNPSPPPDTSPPPPLYPVWLTRILHVLSIAITISLKLVILCALQRMWERTRAPDLLAECIAIYRRALHLVPGFALVVLLQWLATIVGFALLVVPGLVVYVWLYFAEYSLVFDGRRSWLALLFSRDLMRGRFFKVTLRVIVFLAVWSGYNSWAATVFVAASLLLGPVSVMTNSIAASIFVLDLFAVAVTYATIAFFTAAGVRLYQDLGAIAEEPTAEALAAMQPTVPLGSAPA